MILKELITSLTSRKETIFDFFSGGQVLKAALLLQRECIIFVDTPKQCLFLEAYPHVLREIPRVDKFWSLMESIHRGEKVDGEDVSIEDSQLPAEQDGQEVTNATEKDVAEEAVIVHKLNANQSTDPNALAALGIFNLQNEATTSGGAIENNVQGIHQVTLEQRGKRRRWYRPTTLYWTQHRALTFLRLNKHRTRYLEPMKDLHWQYISCHLR